MAKLRGCSWRQAWAIAAQDYDEQRARRRLGENIRRCEKAVKPPFPRGRRKLALDKFFLEVVNWYATNPGQRFTKKLALSIFSRCFAVMPKSKRGEFMQVARADRELRLPGTQAYLAEKFANAGLSTEASCAIVAEIAKDPEQAAGDRLRAVDMVFRLTTGYAPTKSVTANINADKFFDPKVFGDGAPPTIDMEPA